MGSDYGKLTVFFEDPFWVGIFERIESGKLSVCRVVFGSEPKDYEVWEFVLANYHRLRFSPSVDVLRGRKRSIPKGYSGKQGNRPLPESGQSHSRHCSCSGKRTNRNAKKSPASSGRRKNSGSTT